MRSGWHSVCAKPETSIKILLDTVYTQRPDVCSTSYLMWELVDKLASWRPDVFFYLLYPPHKMDEQAAKFMSKHSDRVTLLPLEQSTCDRLSELYMLRNDLRFYLNPWNASTWDTDVVISSRIPVLKHMQVHASRVQGMAMPSYRMHVGLEEMPVLPFRETVPWSNELYPDTLMSYALTDATIVCHQWLKSSIRPVLREVLSPAYQKLVLDKLHEVVPVKLQRLNLRHELYDHGKFKVTFVGRMTGTRNFGDVAELFRKQFSYPLGKNKQDMEFLISTNSESMGAGKYGETDFIDLQMNNREEFYEFLKSAHVAVNLSTVEDFSLSTYETLLAGVPLIVHDRPWNAFLGKEYPFRVKSEVEAYAMVNAFARDYAGQYARFAEWESTYWASYVQGPLNITASEVLITLLSGFESRRAEAIATKGGVFRQRMVELNSQTQGNELNLNSYLVETQKSKLHDQVQEHYSLALGRFPSNLILKMILHEFGWRDSRTCGVLVRS